MTKTFGLKGEIIETYWNVNVVNKSFFPEAVQEIIETYWNVNRTLLLHAVSETQNNRNILECKLPLGKTEK